MAKYRRKLEREEKEKNLRMEKAKNLEKGWELLRLCRDFVREHTDEWSEGQEINKMNKLSTQEEGRKLERLAKCEREREKFKSKAIDGKIMVALEALPVGERENFLAEEERERRREMRSIKENLWKKWRNRREGTVHKGGEEREFEKSEKENWLEKVEKNNRKDKI